jgi:hypothetical protein
LDLLSAGTANDRAKNICPQKIKDLGLEITVHHPALVAVVEGGAQIGETKRDRVGRSRRRLNGL